MSNIHDVARQRGGCGLIIDIDAWTDGDAVPSTAGLCDSPAKHRGHAAPADRSDSGEAWECSHRPRCADVVCSDNPAMQRWIKGNPAPPEDAVERVARALTGPGGDGPDLGIDDWDELKPGTQDAYRRLARAAIAAMDGTR